LCRSDGIIYPTTSQTAQYESAGASVQRELRAKLVNGANNESPMRKDCSIAGPLATSMCR
jgi:hypothetical protein